MIDVIWNSLLEVRRLLSSCDKTNFSIRVLYRENSFHLQEEVAGHGQVPWIKFSFTGDVSFPETLSFYWDENFNVQSPQVIPTGEEYSFIRAYLPYCFSALKSHKLARTYGISHYAQSLDGKIATEDGHSKWISDKEDLIHCHRMRALCDGILIGINTLRNDNPRLNVRHVKGDNPVRIVIGSSSVSFSSLMENKEKIILFTFDPSKTLHGVEQVFLPGKQSIPVFVMQKLYSMGIHSVFIEGGSHTTSSFLENKMIDEIQLYLAPSVFGSGLTDFLLSPIKNVNEAVTFSKHTFTPMGQGILFKGEVKRKLPYSQTDQQKI